MGAIPLHEDIQVYDSYLLRRVLHFVCECVRRLLIIMLRIHPATLLTLGLAYKTLFRLMLLSKIKLEVSFHVQPYKLRYHQDAIATLYLFYLFMLPF